MMHSHFRSILFFIMLLAFACAMSTVGAGEQIAEKKYLKLEEKFKTSKDPVHKVKILIKMSDFQLSKATEKVKNSDFAGSDQDLSAYRELLSQAQEILKSSGRNPQKKPAGFKDLEIALRKQLQILEDLESAYPYNRAQMVTKTIEEAQLADDNMMRQIFGKENFGARKEKK